MATRNDMTNIVAYMKLAFSNYNPVISGGLTIIDVLEDLLGDIPTSELQVAVKACCLEVGRAFAPSPGEIRGKIAELRMKQSGVPSAGEAWQEVYNSFVRMPGGNMSGGGSTPTLDHPAVVETVKQMGGYGAIGLDYDNGQIHFSRARFVKLYEEVVDRLRLDIAEHPMITAQVGDVKVIGAGVKQLADIWSRGKR